MSLPLLSAGQTAAYLDRLGCAQAGLSGEGLARLQVAHLRAVPFHNLLLLANDGRPWGLQPLSDVADAAIAGIGGNCDRTTPPFAALLRSLGFDAHLAAATVREPGDHFVCVVRTEERRFLCDVGNGHPYLRPWALDEGPQEQSFVGWRFRFEPEAPAGPTLLRLMPDGRYKTVYVVDPTPKDYAAFTAMVSAHYTHADFGPFLTGLRAVRIGTDALLSVRDAAYVRDTRFGRSLRQVAGREAIRALLTGRFGLPPELVDAALATLARRRPSLFAEPRWFALGRGLAKESAALPRPTRAEVPDVLVSLATVGREDGVRRLLGSLAEELRSSGYPGRVGVLIVENHAPILGSRAEDPAEIPVRRVPIADLQPALDRTAALGLLPTFDHGPPFPIGAAREAQLAALRAHLDTPLAGLPHPAEHPLVVWMVDDDLLFRQRAVDGTPEHRTNLLFRAARFWSSLPQHAVALGTFTGDPPIPGLDGLGGQLHDLRENLVRMLALGPEAPWSPPPTPSATFDAYYDLSESAGSSPEAVWPFAPGAAGEPVREVALRLLLELPRLLDGQQLTRPLHWDGAETDPAPSLRRGGNTLFLDLDALFRWPTPVVACADGVRTRRADTLWAALARAEAPEDVVEVTLPLHHGREGQSGERVDEAAQTAAQVRGVALARAVAEGRDPGQELRAREARVRAQRRELRVRLARLEDQLEALGRWALPSLDGPLLVGRGAIHALDQRAAAAEPIQGDPRALEALLGRLPEAMRAWRGAW